MTMKLLEAFQQKALEGRIHNVETKRMRDHYLRIVFALYFKKILLIQTDPLALTFGLHTEHLLEFKN